MNTESISPGTDEFDRLIEAFQAHLSKRSVESSSYAPGVYEVPAASEERDAQILRACCLTLSLKPCELGRAPGTSDNRLSVLNEVGPEDLPEARVCRLWLESVSRSSMEPPPSPPDVLGDSEPKSSPPLETTPAASFAALAGEPLWIPIRGLLYRALAFYGQRPILRDLLPNDGPLTLIEADAWLETVHTGEVAADWTDRIVQATDVPLPPDLTDRWILLMKVETALALDERCESVERDVEALLSLGPSVARDNSPVEQVPGASDLGRSGCPARAETYEDREAARIAARAAAARCRLRLARWSAQKEDLDHPALESLPLWEREYLGGLVLWQTGSREAAKVRPGTSKLPGSSDAAISLLRKSLEHNPFQTCTHTALACLLGDRSPEEALELLECDYPTRETLVARTSLLARLGRFEEAEQSLRLCVEDTAVGNEPLRMSFACGRRQTHQQMQALCAALAERRGDWRTAQRAWDEAFPGKEKASLREAGQFFRARRMLDSMPRAQRWQRSLLEQRVKRGRHELGAVPLVGDSLFFRATAVMASDPERSAEDFVRLLRQRSWVEAEQSIGGGRLIFVGDALARLGRFEDAVKAFESAKTGSPSPCDERLAVMYVLAALAQGMSPTGAKTIGEGISKALERAGGTAPESPWPHLLAGLGFLVCGDFSRAIEAATGKQRPGVSNAPGDTCRAAVDEAEKRGAPRIVCRCLRILSSLDSSLETLSDEEIRSLKLPEDAGAVVHLLCGSGTEDERVESFVRRYREDWIERCPADLPRTARRLLAVLCAKGDWEEALQVAKELEGMGLSWARDLASLARLWHALTRCVLGELEEVEKELRALESSLQ